jgi:hypothetical protein
VVKKAENAEGLKKAVQTYAHQHLGTSKNASLMNIYQTLARNNPQAVSAENRQAFLDLDAALYAGKTIDLDRIKEKIVAFLKTKRQESQRDLHSNTRINPS